MLRILIAAAGAAVLASSVQAQVPSREKAAFTVIVNAENPVSEVSMPELARIYLGKKTLWESGTRIHAAMLGEEQAVIRDFIEKDMQRTLDQYRAYWKHMLFSGGGTAPRTFRTPLQVIEFVAREPGAIGIVMGSRDDERVKVVEVRGGR